MRDQSKFLNGGNDWESALSPPTGYNDTRRRLILIAAVSYYALRIWTYLAYAANRVEIASRPLSADDLEWFYRSLGVDYRPILVAVVLAAFTATAFVPDPSSVAEEKPSTSQDS